MENVENKKIKVLMSENQNIRNEIIMYSKTTHYCFFAFISSFGAFIGIIFNLNTQDVSSNLNFGFFTFIISQIEFIIIVYSIMLTSDVFSKAAYIEYIETKINSILNDNLIFWESRVSTYQQRNGALVLSQFILYIFYFCAFGVLAVLSYYKICYHLYFWVQIIEVLVIFYLLFKLSQQYSKVGNYIKNFDNIKKVVSKKIKINYELLIPLFTFITGIFAFSIIAIFTNSFWFHSGCDVPILKSPSLFLGDSIFIPLFNYLLFKLYKMTKTSIDYKKYSLSFIIYLSTVAIISFYINYVQHIAWTKDQLTGFIDLTLNRLSIGGWYHMIFASIEMTIMLLLFWFVIVIIIEKNDNGFKFSKKLFWVFFFYSSCALFDLIVKIFWVTNDKSLFKGLSIYFLDLKVFFLGILLLIVYYITSLLLQNKSFAKRK